MVRARFGKKIKGASFEFSDFSKSVATKPIPAKVYQTTLPHHHITIMPTAAEIKQALEKAREDRVKAEAAALLEEERLTAEMVVAEEVEKAEKARKEAEKKKREEDAARAQALIEKRRREAEAAALKRATDEMAVEDDWEERLEAARIASEKEMAEEYRASACRYCRSKGIKCVRSG